MEQNKSIEKNIILDSLINGVSQSVNITESEKKVICEGIKLLYSNNISQEEYDAWQFKCYDNEFYTELISDSISQTQKKLLLLNKNDEFHDIHGIIK